MAEIKEHDDNFWKILDAALELDVKKGHLKWTLSDLSRKSGITRSLIYYYFGRSKESILNEAIKLIGTELAGLNKKREKLWLEGQFLESLIEARSIFDKAPYLHLLIAEHIGRDTELGVAVRDIQTRFIAKINRVFKLSDNNKSRAIYSLYWGMLFAPMQDKKTYEHSIKVLKNFI